MHRAYHVYRAVIGSNHMCIIIHTFTNVKSNRKIRNDTTAVFFCAVVLESKTTLYAQKHYTFHMILSYFAKNPWYERGSISFILGWWFSHWGKQSQFLPRVSASSIERLRCQVLSCLRPGNLQKHFASAKHSLGNTKWSNTSIIAIKKLPSLCDKFVSYSVCAA
jgi:hypothetical protein